jgi:hypothetical protein
VGKGESRHPRARLLASRDGGRHWRVLRLARETTRLLAATPTAIWLAQLNQLAAVVRPDGRIRTQPLPAGKTLALLTDRVDPDVALQVLGLPGDATVGLRVSVDAGRTWRTLSPPPLPARCDAGSATLVAHARVLLASGGRCGVWLSDPVR